MSLLQQHQSFRAVIVIPIPGPTLTPILVSGDFGMMVVRVPHVEDHFHLARTLTKGSRGQFMNDLVMGLRCYLLLEHLSEHHSYLRR